MEVARDGIMHPVDDFLMVVKAAMLEMMMMGKMAERYYYYVQLAFKMLVGVLKNLPVVYSYRYDAREYITETSNAVLGDDEVFEFGSSGEMVNSFLAFLRRALDWCAKFDEPPDMGGHGIEFMYPTRPTRIQRSTMGYFVRPKVPAAIVADAAVAAANLHFSNQVGEVSVRVPSRDLQPGEAGPSSSGGGRRDPAQANRGPVARVTPFVVERRYEEGEPGENGDESDEDGGRMDGDEDAAQSEQNNDDGMDYESDVTDHSSAWGEEPDRRHDAEAGERGSERSGSNSEADERRRSYENDDIQVDVTSVSEDSESDGDFEERRDARIRGATADAPRPRRGEREEDDERGEGAANDGGRRPARRDSPDSVIVIDDTSSSEDETFPPVLWLQRRDDPRTLLSRTRRAASRTRTIGGTRPRSRSPHRRGEGRDLPEDN
ncbi:unknown [Psittacid alphaherpesvirus 1]|uniref:Uncharacterized protein UL-1 n=2 Tax=Psittacid alphaherpesvirus 1 TaxID=50294 RepID=UL01_PSHV1|nr:RecName: Full=Uncharacterized protein UL-1 [Psittacid herpesvirus 1 Amazon parrot/1997]AAQ73746.1 unknown [Psittacid alphaherpesvirus 1]